MNAIEAYGAALKKINSVLTGLATVTVDDVNKSITFTFNDGGTQTMHFDQPKDGVSVIGSITIDDTHFAWLFDDGTQSAPVEYPEQILKIDPDTENALEKRPNGYFVEKSGDADLSYDNPIKPEWDTMKKALDGIIDELEYVEPEIITFTVTPATLIYEVGQRVSSLTFNWSLNKDVTSQSLTGCTVNDTDRTARYTTLMTNSKIFTLSVSDGENSATKSISISFQNKAYWGSGPLQALYDSNFVLGLANSRFATTIVGAYNMTVNAGEYGWLCVPNTFTAISSWFIGGFECDLVDEGTISFTNASGGNVTYHLYRTTRSGIGAISMEVKP